MASPGAGALNVACLRGLLLSRRQRRPVFHVGHRCRMHLDVFGCGVALCPFHVSPGSRPTSCQEGCAGPGQGEHSPGPRSSCPRRAKPVAKTLQGVRFENRHSGNGWKRPGHPRPAVGRRPRPAQPIASIRPSHNLWGRGRTTPCRHRQTQPRRRPGHRHLVEGGALPKSLVENWVRHRGLVDVSGGGLGSRGRALAASAVLVQDSVVVSVALAFGALPRRDCRRVRVDFGGHLGGEALETSGLGGSR